MGLIKFSIDSMEVLDNIENSLFREVRIKAFASGENVHTLPIDEDVIIRASRTIYNKPILWKYNKYIDDALGHEKDEVACGFVPEVFHGKENKVSLERIDGRLFIVINALIWTRYCGRLIEIFERDDSRKDVSVEIATIEDENSNSDKPKILDFVIAGITILGEWINPACKGCEAELLAFSEDKKKYMNNIYNNFMYINNMSFSKSENGWSNPRRKLFNSILKYDNKKEMLEEVYAIHGDLDNPKYTDFKFPHHTIKDNMLVIDLDGLNTAMQNIYELDSFSKKHIIDHYKNLGISEENFDKFKLSKDDYLNYFSENRNVGDDNMNENKDMEKDKKMEETVEKEKENMCNCSEEKPVEKMEEDPVENKENMSGEDIYESEKCYSDDGSEIPCSEKVKQMEEKMSKLEEENKAYMSKIAEMSDYEELKKYKEMSENEKAKEKEMAEMNKVMSDIESKGIEMSKEDKEKLMSKIKEFSDVNAWSNYAKSYVFDNKVGNLDSFALPYENNNNSSIWDNF